MVLLLKTKYKRSPCLPSILKGKVTHGQIRFLNSKPIAGEIFCQPPHLLPEQELSQGNRIRRKDISRNQSWTIFLTSTSNTLLCAEDVFEDIQAVR